MTSADGHCYDIICWKGEATKTYEVPHNDLLVHFITNVISTKYDRIVVSPRWATQRHKKY